jgi:hypothetical protein
VFYYIYFIDVNLKNDQNNSRLFVDVDKLPNHVKSVSFSLDFSLFDSIYCSSLSCAVITGCKRDVIIIVMIKCFLLAKSQFSF